MDTAAFFSYLNRRSEADTSVVATLRRSASHDPGTDPRAYPLIERWTAALSERDRQTVYLTASCWAIAARRTSGTAKSLPQVLRHIRAAGSNSIEARFTALLDADPDELRWRLRQAISLVSSTGAAIDWPLLLDDLLRWNLPSRSIQSKWARQFWAPAHEESAA